MGEFRVGFAVLLCETSDFESIVAAGDIVCALPWQSVPRVMDKMLRDNDQARLARVTDAFLKMKKFVLRS